MQTLAALVIQSLSRYWYPESYVAQVRVVITCHLRAIGNTYGTVDYICYRGKEPVLTWKKDQAEACWFAVTPSMSIKDWILEHFFVMLNACLSLSCPGPSAWPRIWVAQLRARVDKYKVRLGREP
jgi:hypothetical protein